MAVAAGARAGVHLATRAGEAPVPYAFWAVAALVYLVLAVALRRGDRSLEVATVAAAAELAGVLVIGTPSGWGRWPGPTNGVVGLRRRLRVRPLVLPVVALVILRRQAARRVPSAG